MSKSKTRHYLPWLFVLLTWCICSMAVAVRLHNFGAFATAATAQTLRFTQSTYGSDPAHLDLNNSYTQWALGLLGTDQGNYLRVGLGFADGKGLRMKMITVADQDSRDYMPYYFQSPGAPLVIGTLIKLFGEGSVWPYFIFSVLLYLAGAIIASLLARRFLKSEKAIAGVAILNLLCLPAIDFNLGSGLFASEPLAAPFFGIAMIVLTDFWNHSLDGSAPKKVLLPGIAFGATMAAASYMRDFYTGFMLFCVLSLLLAALFDLKRLTKICFFSASAIIVFFALQAPWEKRNSFYFKEYTMSGCTYYGRTVWAELWCDYKRPLTWSRGGGLGVGNYLEPEKSVEVMSALRADVKRGSQVAAVELFKAVARQPLKAIEFKLRDYDYLWFGQRNNYLIYGFCLISAVFALMALLMSGWCFAPGLSLFPIFMLFISVFIHYEDRYCQPFYLFVSPVCIVFVFSHWKSRQNQTCISICRSENGGAANCHRFASKLQAIAERLLMRTP